MSNPERFDLNKLEIREKPQETVRVILIRGIPGSGKSTVSGEIVKRIGQASCAIIDPDDIDYEGRDYSDFVEKTRIECTDLDSKFYPYRFMLDQFKTAIRNGKCVIWNQPFSNTEGLEHTLNKIEEIGRTNSICLAISIVEVSVNPQIAYARVSRRIENGGHGPSPFTFVEFIGRFESFGSFNRADYLKMDGNTPPEINAQLIIERVFDEH